MSVLRRVGAFAWLTLALGIAAAADPPGVAAECDPPGASTSFRKAAPHAARVVVGEVLATAPDGIERDGAWSSIFTVGVQAVLRGPAAATVDLHQVETGGCVRWLSAALGDVVVIAFDTSSPDPLVATNAAAWLRGHPPDSTGFEMITLEELRVLFPAAAFAGPELAPAPPPEAPREPEPGPFPAMLPVALAVGAVVAVRLAAARLRQRH